MIKQGNGQTTHHLGLALCMWLGSIAFLATGVWATILLVLTSRITAALIITLIGGWVTLAGIFACFVTPGLFLAAMPFACWVLTSVWRLTLER